MEAELDYTSSDADDGFTTDSTDAEDSDEPNGNDHDSIQRTRNKTAAAAAIETPNSQPTSNENLLLKLFNRERTGCLSGGAFTQRLPQRPFNKVPNRLGFVLKGFVPENMLQGHMFMGLSACGQFILSYKISCNDNIRMNHNWLNIGYSYTLYFWLFQPHKPLRTFYKCCLFDDHGVDNIKKVTMVQWRTDPRVLIVHGAAEVEQEDDFITYIKVPKPGCLECKKLREFDDDGCFRCFALCLRCNVTIHTKYSRTESDRKFDAQLNLICPGRIFLMANGFLHMICVDEEYPAIIPSTQQQQHIHQPINQSIVLNSLMQTAKATPPYEGSILSSGSSLGNVLMHDPQLISQSTNIASCLTNESGNSVCDNGNNIVARIIADFSAFETDSTHSSGTTVAGFGSAGRHHGDEQRPSEAGTPGSISSIGSVSRKATFDEVVFSCNNSSPGSSASVSGSPVAGCSNTAKSSGVSSRVSLVNHTGRRHQRIVNKSFKNGVTTVDLQNAGTTATSTTNAADKSNTYEFSEDTEKCEKIATLRKRRLADKKYEFSEDNSENIIPFTKIRSAARTFGGGTLGGGGSGGVGPLRTHQRAISTGHHFHGSPCASPSSSPHPHSSNCDGRHYTPPPMQRMSPITQQQLAQHQQEFRSPPCNSPVGAGLMRSPSRHAAAGAHGHGHMSPSMTAHVYGQKSPTNQPLSAATQYMLSFKPGALSPLQLSLTKRNAHLELGGAMSPNTTVPFLSPRREELYMAMEVQLASDTMPEKPMCSKKFRRRYVEEDDAASVITSEEDDCISPGYHTSLPMEVHGSCYSEMQMISKASYQRLRCASIIVTQHSFDLETFSYYTINMLCHKNGKTLDLFLDWDCQLISVCPISNVVTCLLLAQFKARDQVPTTAINCLNCSRKLDCVFHRRQFDSRILFTWNLESGDWEVLDYGEMLDNNIDIYGLRQWTHETPTKLKKTTFTDRARKLANEMRNSLKRIQMGYVNNLHILSSNVNKSKNFIIDEVNMISLHLKRPRH